MHNVRYDFSSCHVDVPTLLAKEIADWGKVHISDEEIYVTYEDPTFGREDEIHITVLYGIHTDNYDEVKSILENAGPAKIILGKTEVFSNPFKFDVLMIEAFSNELIYLNNKLREQLKFTNNYMQYNPHVTVSYVKKGKGWKHRGVNLWEGQEFVCNYAVFSAKNGVKQRISLA